MGGEDDHGASTQEPDLVEAMPWGVKERLTFEKTAMGFYLSGHLFDEVSLEVRQASCQARDCRPHRHA
jgi:DNA polymerase-3 subunit alpha